MAPDPNSSSGGDGSGGAAAREEATVKVPAKGPKKKEDKKDEDLVRGVDHQWDGELFDTAGAQLDVWNYNSFEWGSDTVISVRFNPGEPNVLATSGSDRSITLYDLRMTTPIRKIIIRTKTNAISWNPMEPMNFTAANEDCNCYSYDARKLQEAKCVHKDQVSAVMDINYSPTG